MRLLLPFLLIALSAGSANWLRAQQPATSPPASTARPPRADKFSLVASPQDVLKRWVGTWNATIETVDRQGKLVTNTAKAKVRLGYGGRWLVSEFDGTFMGAPFIGQEVLGYDPVAKKYILNWIDSAATSFSTGEGTFYHQTETMSLNVTGRDDSTGKMTTWRQIDTWKGPDNHEWTIRTLNKEGREHIQMTIRYRRQA
jgi:hypothetical protein